MNINKEALNKDFGTLSQTINGLIKLGYTHDFNIKEECLICNQNNVALSPDDFQIDRVFRFEGASNPDDTSILYAISSPRFNIQGTVVNGYGISAEIKSSKIVAKLQSHK
jgi:hypothetical protein